MQCIVTYATDMCICLKSFLRYTFLILDTLNRTRYIYVSKDVRILDYFSKPQGVREKKKGRGEGVTLV
jgi:hypothetical protein